MDDPTIAVYTRTKKRAFELNNAAGKIADASQIPIKENNKGETVAQVSTPQIHVLQKNPPVASKGQPQLQADRDMEQPHHKAKSAVPFNIMDNMKKLNVNMSVWDTLAILGQKDMLQVALEEIKGESIAAAARGSVLTNHP